ncbi:Fic family protein [Gemella morbillorum]
MKYTQDYLNDILIRMAYHSSAIEGNTITLPETVSIILENTLPISRKGIREFYEIENHKQAFECLFDNIDNNKDLNIDLLLDLHRYLVDRLQHDAGCFKSSQNAIVGAEFQTASPSETPYLVRQWIDNTNYRLNNAKEDTEILEILADTHIQFERIHPFSDGNGRCGRLVLLYLGIKYLHSPLIISKENRAEYMEYLAEQNIAGLTTLLSNSLEFEKERITQFN